MRPATRACSLLSSFIITALLALSTRAGMLPTAVLTQHNDNARTGDNLTETTLTVTNVNTNTFGLLYSRPVDDEIYAQPLIMTNVSISGVGPRNLLIIATVNDTVYAYDADDPTVVAPYWTNTFVQPPNIVTVSDADQNAIGACGGSYQDFDNNMGIVGTPVIDPVSGTIYLVARTKEISGGQTNFFQRLHALDATTGLDRTNSPVVIEPTFPGTGDGGDGTNLTFDPLRQNQRPALLLVNGIIYICWSSHCDNGPYHGWVLGYNAASMQQVITFVNTPNGSQGGIWMSGQGPSADRNGNIFVASGNGSVDSNDFGQSILKLTNNDSGTLGVVDFFIPRDWQKRDDNDMDLGCTGMLLVPGTSLAVSATKYGEVFVVNRDNMGGLNRSTAAVPNPLQSWSLGGRREIHCSSVWWTCTNGSFMYIWGASGDRLRQYELSKGKFREVATSDKTSGWPGGMLSVSANGTNTGTGIIWAVTATSYPLGALRAYNAQKVSHELWDSDKLPGDAMGYFAKYVPPTIANGKVYVATFNNQVQVYGLR